MGYIDKKIAMQYLANSEKLFNSLKNNFISNYKEYKDSLSLYLNDKNYEGIYNIIHQIKGFSLNIGSEVLYNDSIHILEEIQKKGETSPFLVECYIESLEMCYLELSRM